MLNIEWTQIFTIGGLFISVCSFFLARSTHRMALFSQKLQNAQALISSFYSSLEENDIHDFREIIVLMGEAAGGDNYGHYLGEDSQLHDFSVYFSEGAPDGGVLGRIVYNLNRVCFFAKNEGINLYFFYSELGRFIRICYEILNVMDSIDKDEDIVRCYQELEQKYFNVPMRIIGSVE